MGETPEEDLIAWLERTEEELGFDETLTALQQGLKDTLHITTDAQLEGLRQASGLETGLAEHGIHAVTVTYPWGKELRYGIQGMPGLWGYASVQQIREGEDW